MPLMRIKLIALAACYFTVAAAQAPVGEPQSEALSVLSVNTPCRMVPQLTTCGLPLYLANFQGRYQCDIGVKIGRPANLDQLQRIVAAFPHVKASGVGHSWWEQQFCSGNTSDAINIVTTELEPTVKFIEKPVDPAVWLNTTIPADFPIKVDEENATVTVAAGLTQRHVLDYLAAYTHWKQPDGWTLPAFSWFVDQTIGGAVATGTHGSTFTWGSLSSQVRALKLVLANGTLLELNSPEENPHLWKAVAVSVGRLGVITELTFRIIPNTLVTRTTQNITLNDFLGRLTNAQEAYKAAKASNDVAGMQAALYPFDDTQTFWVAPLRNFFLLNFTDARGKNASDIRVNLTIPEITAMQGPPQASSQLSNLPGVDQQVVRPAVAPDHFQANNSNVMFLAEIAESAVGAYLVNGTYSRRLAFPSEHVGDVEVTDHGAPFDQYEAAVPFERAADCLRQIMNAVYGPEDLWKWFRTPALIRFINGEDFYISTANKEPTMFLNFEDYVEPSGGGKNIGINRVAQLFLEGDCRGRYHWGKAGWTEHLACFDGAQMYPDTWCDFGCAVAELDPTNKFASESNVWRWNATRGGVQVPLSSCCTAQGFNKAECQCGNSSPCGPKANSTTLPSAGKR